MKKTIFFSLFFFAFALTINAQFLPGTNGNTYYNSGKVSINTQTPAIPQDMYLTIKGSQINYGLGSNQFFGGQNNTTKGWGEYGIEYNEGEGGLNFWKPYGNTFDTTVDGINNWILFLGDNGNIGIGTKNLTPGFKLTVAGGINAREILVTETAGGADFVFEENFKLRSLTELESFVNKNKHLPDIPSAKEMEENGLNMAEFQIKLLQKVEELTLYIIAQQKEIEELKNKVK